MTAPTLLQIVPTLAGGGLARATLDAAQAVIAEGGSAIVASPGGSMVPDLLRARATHLELPPISSSLWARLILPRKLASSLARADIGVIQARSPQAAWIARALASRLGVKWIATLHRPLDARGLMPRYVQGRLAQADALLAVSDYVARNARERLPDSADRLVVIPPGINRDRFDPAIVRADRVIKLARELRVPDGAPVVLCPARLDQDRGQKILIDAIRRLDREDVFCLLLGSTGETMPFEKELESAIAAQNLLGRVQIGPFVEDMPAAYMLADVVVATGGAREGFSRTLVEAMAMGRPVVAEDGGGAAESIVPGVTGWIAPPNDATGLADAVASALALSVQGRIDLARAAQEQVRSHYDLALSNKELLALYGRLAS